MHRRLNPHRELLKAEAEFAALGDPALQRVSEGGNPLFFFTPDYNPLALPHQALPPTGTQLLAIAKNVHRLRIKLRLDLETSAACRLVDISLGLRAGPPRVPARKLARELLALLRRPAPAA